MVAAVTGQGGFDTSGGHVDEATVISWIEDYYRKLVARTQWRKAEISFGNTVAGQAQYAVPANVVDVRKIRVAGRPYRRVGIDDLDLLKAGEDTSPRPVFAPAFEADADAVVELWPVPEAGQAITSVAALLPPALSAGSSVPAVPEDFHQAIVDGAIAEGMRRIYQRHDDAQQYEQRFEDAVKELKRRANSRIGSGRPSWARVA